MKVKFNVTGMTCAACSARVEKVTKAVPGVSGAEVNLLAGKMVADVENEAAAELICKAVTDAGYGASVEDGRKKEAPKAPAEDALKEMKVRIVGSGVFLVILMYLTMGHMVGLPTPHIFHGLNNAALFALVQFLLTLPAVILNRAYFSKGLKALWHRSPNMDSLIAVGSGASLIYGVVALLRMTWAQGNGQWEVVELYSKNLYFESAAMILTLITLASSWRPGRRARPATPSGSSWIWRPRPPWCGGMGWRRRSPPIRFGWGIPSSSSPAGASAWTARSSRDGPLWIRAH